MNVGLYDCTYYFFKFSARFIKELSYFLFEIQSFYTLSITYKQILLPNKDCWKTGSGTVKLVLLGHIKFEYNSMSSELSEK